MDQSKLDQLIHKCSADQDVIACILYGSQATGLVHSFSDIDLAFFLGNHTLHRHKRLELLDLSTRMLETDNVDVIILNNAPLDLSFQVISKGRLLYLDTSYKAEWIHFRERTTLEYLDYLPLLELHYEAMLERIEEGRFGG